MSEEPKRPSSFQFRLSFLFCLVLLMAVFLGGTKFDEEAWGLEQSYRWGATCALTGPITAGIVLLLGRSIAAVPMAIGIMLPVMPIGIWFFAEVRLPHIPMLDIAFLLGSVLSVIRMLWQRVTPARTLLGIPASFFLGYWLAAALQNIFLYAI
jgi:hypothetical protein